MEQAPTITQWNRVGVGPARKHRDWQYQTKEHTVEHEMHNKKCFQTWTANKNGQLRPLKALDTTNWMKGLGLMWRTKWWEDLGRSASFCTEHSPKQWHHQTRVSLICLVTPLVATSGWTATPSSLSPSSGKPDKSKDHQDVPEASAMVYCIHYATTHP